MVGGTFASLMLHAFIAGLIVGVLPRLAASDRTLPVPPESQLDVEFRTEPPLPAETPVIDLGGSRPADAVAHALRPTPGSRRDDVLVVADGGTRDAAQGDIPPNIPEAHDNAVDTATKPTAAQGSGDTSTVEWRSGAGSDDAARAAVAAEQARGAAQEARSHLEASQRAAGEGALRERTTAPEVRLSLDTASAHVLSAEAAAESAENQARRAAEAQQSSTVAGADIAKAGADAAEKAKDRAFAETLAAANALTKMPMANNDTSYLVDAGGRPLPPSVSTILEAVAKLDKRLPQPSPIDTSASHSPQQAAALIKRYQAAATAGFAYAQYNLAEALVARGGVPPDPEKAIQLLRQLAERGYQPGEMRLAEEDLRGEAASASKAEAFAWYTIAARDGNKAAVRAQSLLGPLLIPMEREHAERLTQQLEARLVQGRRNTPLPEQQEQLDKALLLAVESDDAGAADRLIGQGADPNALDKYGRSAVISAAWRGRAKIVSLLVSRGVDVDAHDDQGRTALGWAAINGYPDMAAELIAAGGATDTPDLDGLTPLIRAAWNNHPDIVRSLLHAGAAIDLRDGAGKTALDRAMSQGNEEIALEIRRAQGTR